MGARPTLHERVAVVDSGGYEKMEDSHRGEREDRVKAYDRWMERIYTMKQELSQRGK